jgi:hypothetical protein
MPIPLRRVYIKRAGGEIASEACYTAWKGFSHKAYPLDFFEPEDLAQKQLVLDKRTLVVGGTTTVHQALRQIGVEVPLPLNIPESLLPFAGRRISTMTLGELRSHFQAEARAAVFVIPLVHAKTIQGSVISHAADLRSLEHLDENLALQTSDVVAFSSEWRYYVHRGAVVGLAHYRGDWMIFPPAAMVQRAVAEHIPAPIAYSLDFGITSDGRTLLVEANDAFALGAYGLDAVVYATMLEDRWLEIVGIDPTH